VPMTRPADQLHQDALRIWHAAVDAVRSERLLRDALRVEGPNLLVGDEPIRLADVRRIAVVGAGKAGAGMAAAVEEVLGGQLMEQKHLAGWVNVPEDCVRKLGRITLHGARPAGVNEPTAAGAAGSAEILRLVESLGPDDLCLCLISGGGSALMPAPVEAITLEDKLAVTRHLSAAGANIEQLNTVRKQLSRIKGGGLMRACRAGRLVSLIISDVLGDPLDVIASGPTVEDPSTPEAALAVLEQFDARSAGISPAVFDYLHGLKKGISPICAKHRAPPGGWSGRCAANGTYPLFQAGSSGSERSPCRVSNLIIGNNAAAVDAAGREAERLGYAPALESATKSEGPAEQIGVRLAEMALAMRARSGPDCLVSGGEPVVKLVPSAQRGLGGRSQQLVLAALEKLAADGAEGIALLSGGTDGEDGPTDAAGAVLDAAVIQAAKTRGLDPADHLARNDAYHFFEPLAALIRTGPTHTNVCDVRVVVVDRIEGAS